MSIDESYVSIFAIPADNTIETTNLQEEIDEYDEEDMEYETAQGSGGTDFAKLFGATNSGDTNTFVKEKPNSSASEIEKAADKLIESLPNVSIEGIIPTVDTIQNANSEDIDCPFIAETPIEEIAVPQEQETGAIEHQQELITAITETAPLLVEIGPALITPHEPLAYEEEKLIQQLKSKKQLTCDERAAYGDILAKQRIKEKELLNVLVDSTLTYLANLPVLDIGKINEACENRPTLRLPEYPTFEDCIRCLNSYQNYYSYLSDIYQAILPVVKQWEKAEKRLMAAFNACSEKSADEARQGETYLYTNKFNMQVSHLAAILKRVEIALNLASSDRDTVSRMITALQQQYSSSGALCPSMDILEQEDSGYFEEKTPKEAINSAFLQEEEKVNYAELFRGGKS